MTHSTIDRRQRALGGLWGSLVGDALGVPVEFQDRSVLKCDPVTGPRSFGTHHQPAPFERVLTEDLAATAAGNVASSGYVLHTLHASLWCLLTTNSYRDCVLRAVNLGGDTDTTACVAGGLAGVHYGLTGIPEEWRRGLLRQDDLNELLERFANELGAP